MVEKLAVSNICLKTFRSACAVMAVAAMVFAYDQGDPPPQGRHWSLAQAREWGRENPWYCWFNHVPANSDLHRTALPSERLRHSERPVHLQ